MERTVKSFNSLQTLLENVVGNQPIVPAKKEEPKEIEKVVINESLKEDLPKLSKIVKPEKESKSKPGTPSEEYMKNISERLSVFNKIDKEISNSKTNILNESSILETIDTEGRYKVYRDKEETFECNVSVEGTSLSTATARLVFISSTWNIFFDGTISNGKCTIPLKKMIIFEEGETGEARLEIVIDDALFIPWKESFIVEKAKKVEIEVKAIKSITIS